MKRATSTHNSILPFFRRCQWLITFLTHNMIVTNPYFVPARKRLFLALLDKTNHTTL